MFEYACMDGDLVFESLFNDLWNEAFGNVAQIDVNYVMVHDDNR